MLQCLIGVSILDYGSCPCHPEVGTHESCFVGEHLSVNLFMDTTF